MAGTFSFGFAGDDIDLDDVNEENELEQSSNRPVESHQTDRSPELFPAERHQLQDWVKAHPQICKDGLN